MSKTLGGFCIIREGIKYDYCFEQAIISLLGCCDKVAVVSIGNVEMNDDGTRDILSKLVIEYGQNTLLICDIYDSIWHIMKGKTKLSNLQNIAAMCLDTDYQLLVQADEIIHPDSYQTIREAMKTGGEGFLCKRVNLWGDPNHMLVVPQERQPCRVYVNRLTKRGYWCYGDGESIASPTTLDFADRIKIVHYGFVRKREVMKAKIINMQEGVFDMGHHDPKLNQSEVFDSTLWFSGNDLAPINFEHPTIMKEWVAARM